MIYHFILNPKSGKKKAGFQYEDAIKAACQSRHLDYHIYYTTCVGDATAYVRSMVRISSERQRFICVGGDGTLNELVNSAPSNPMVEFGVIPGGSGNDFVKNFTNPAQFYNIDAQLDGETVSLDLIQCNDMYCMNMLNIGFDCSVVKEAARLKKWKLVSPAMSYIFGVVIALCKRFGTKMKIVFDDGEVIQDDMLLTAIGNGRFCGGGFDAAPRAFLNDGLMDVCAIKKITRRKFISLVKKYKNGTYLSDPKAMKYIRYRQVPHFRMEFEQPIPVCNDGEICGAKSLEFTIVPNGFRFVLPKGSTLRFPKRADN